MPDEPRDPPHTQAGEEAGLIWCDRCSGYHQEGQFFTCRPDKPAPVVKLVAGGPVPTIRVPSDCPIE